MRKGLTITISDQFNTSFPLFQIAYFVIVKSSIFCPSYNKSNLGITLFPAFTTLKVLLKYDISFFFFPANQV